MVNGVSPLGTPDALEEVAVRANAARSLAEGTQQAELSGGERHEFPTLRDHTAFDVRFNISHPHSWYRPAPRCPTQQRLDTRDQLRSRNGLDQVLVGSHIKAADDALF